MANRPLLESSEGREGLKFSFWGRAGEIASGDIYQKAAALVDLADDGEGIPSEVLEHDQCERAIKFYVVYGRLDILWSLNLLALIVLNFFEVPLWCKEDNPNPCGSKEKYFLGDLPYLTRLDSLAFETVCLLILSVHTLFPILFMGNKIFWTTRLNVFKVILVLFLIADTIANTIYISPSGAISTLPVRLAPYIRVCIVAASIGDVRDSIGTLLGIIPDFSDVAALLLLFLLFSSWLAYVLFEDTQQGQEVFTSFPKTLYSMTILFTTSNNPDVWLPAYKQSRFSALFFVLFILIGVFFVTNLVLAVVYDSFKGQLAASLLQQEQKRATVLEITFNILDVHKRGSLDQGQCKELFKALNNYRTLPKIQEDDMETIFYALDDSGDVQINKNEFADLCSAISLKFEKSDAPQWLEQFPGLFNHRYLVALRAFVKSRNFEYIVLGLLGLNLITVIIETTLDLEDDKSQAIWQSVELSFGWIYLVELTLKVVVYGFQNYWRSGQNRFDFFITWIIVICETLALALPNGLPFLKNSEWIRYLLIARLLRLVRVLMLVERYRVKLLTFLNLIPNLLPYLGINFFLMCIYCSIGVQAFGGLMYEGNPALDGTEMAENDYYTYNFNDYASGMVTLFNLLVMGNWQMWMEDLVSLVISCLPFQENQYSVIWGMVYAMSSIGVLEFFVWAHHMFTTYSVLANRWWAILYFMSFYVVAVLFLLNLVVAFVLEAFFAEIDINAEVKAEEQEVSSDQDGSQPNRSTFSDPRSEKARQRARRGKDQRVQNLLNHMLSSEMEKSKSVHRP